MKRLLDWLFGKAEEINGRRCPTYLYRWVIAKNRLGSVYLHHFVGDDWSRDMHNHPKRFISVGLWGSYVEESPSHVWGAVLDRSETISSDIVTRTYRAPWIRTFPACHVHRLAVPSKNCWTLVVVGRGQQEWGFYPEGRWMKWDEYVRGVEADRARNCP